MRRIDAAGSLAFATLAVVAFLLSFVDGVPLLRAATAITALSIVPGVAALRAVTPRARLDLAMALALSPFLLGALMTGLLMAGFDATLAARVCALAAAAGLGYDVWRRIRGDLVSDRGEAPPDPRTDEGRPTVSTLLLTAALCAAIAWPLATSNRVRTSVHGMLHGSILYRLIDAGAPPENPFFAAETLRYYWTWHAAEAAHCLLGRVDPTVAFAASNVTSLLAFLLLLARLTVALGAPRRLGWVGMLLGFLCMNPLGALFFAGKRTSTQGYATLDELAQGTDPIFHIQALAAGHDERITSTFTKFLNVSSFPPSFALLIAMWLLCAQLARRPLPSTALLLALATAGSIALSPITGVTGGFAVGLGAAVVAATALVSERWRDGRNGGLMIGVALVTGLVAAAPFVLLGGAGGGEGQTIGLDPTAEKLRSLLLNLGPVSLIALPAMIGALRRREPGGSALALSIVPLLLMAVLIWFPVASEYKMTRMAAPLLGAFAAVTIHAAGRRRAALGAALAVAALALFVPTNALVYRAYLAHRHATLPYHSDGIDVVVDPSEHPAAEMYAWIRANTPADAVIVDNPDMKQRHFAGPLQGDEVPALAHRPSFTDVAYYMTDYEPDFPARYRMVQKLFKGAAWDSEDVQRLRALSRPVYVLLRAYDAGVTQAMATLAADDRFTQVARTQSAFLFELRRGGSR